MTAASAWLGLSLETDMLERPGQVLDLVSAARQRRIGHEVLVSRERALAVPAGRPVVGALGVQQPTLRLVIQVGHHDLLEHLLVHRRILDGCHDLDPPVEISGHPVRRTDEHARLGRRHRSAVGERDDPGVLEKPADDALDTDVFRQAGDPGAQAT